MSTNTPDLKSILARALEIKSREERQAYVDQTCAGNDSLRAEVDGLLAAADNAGSFMNRPPVVAAPEAKLAATIIGSPLQEGPGTIIGPYKLLQQIGEGGFGVVYMAAQERPVRRNVALKIIKPGMDSREVIARFEAERQALAMMDHQNIARVLDAGTTDTGRPYFVMELVKGIPITNYCDNNKLTPRERLELFVPVCNAIQHAHQKGIIHRDIKPSNVLVCLYDGKPVPKVIDFGVAKAIEQRLTEKTMFTQHGQVIGTLEYMSPEQAEMSQLDIDTRSDIYSLGVLLYELLTGSTPLTKDQLRKSGFVEMLRMIRETEPEKPSLRLSHSLGTLASISAQRRTEPAKLGALIRGDLDWLVMKALEKDRTRRYETANSLARDIERYLHDEPVEACPPSIGYRLRKFTRRNRPAVITGTIVAVLALTLLANFFVAHFRLEQARARASEAEQLAVNRLEEAEGERERAKQAEKVSQAERDKAVVEQRRADEQAREALIQKERADTKTKEALASLELSEQRLYFNQINSAHQYWEANDIGQVHRIMEAAPSRFRNWEWHYLQRLCHSELKTLPGHGQFVNKVQFSADGKRLMTFTPFGDSGCKVWNAETYEEIVSISQGVARPSFSSGCLSADGKLIALCDQSGIVNLWDTDTGKELRNIGKLNVPAGSLNFSPDGRLIAAAWRETTRSSPVSSLLTSKQREVLKVWDVASGAEVFAPRGVGVMAAFSPDGKLLLAYSRIFKIGLLPGTPDYEVKLWETTTWKEQRTLSEAVWQSFDISPDSRRVVVAGVESKTYTAIGKIIEIETGKEVALRELPLYSGDITFDRDGKQVIVAASQFSNPLTVYNAMTGDVLRKFRGHTRRITSITGSPTADVLVSASEDRTVKFWNTNRDQEIESLPGQAVMYSTTVAFSPNRQHIAWGSGIPVLLARNAPIDLWNIAESETSLTMMGHKDGLQQVVYSSDGQFLASIGRDKLAKVWDTRTGKEVCTFRGHQGEVQCVAISPDGRWAVSVDEDPAVSISRRPPYKQLEKYPPGVAIVWDAKTGQEIRRLHGHATGIYRVAINPDGTRIASTNANEGIIWDAANGKELIRLSDKPGSMSLLFSPDGRWLATADFERTIHLWDAATGEKKHALRGHTATISHAAVTFNSDGTRLASAGGDVKIWDVATGQELLSLKSLQGINIVHGLAFTPDNCRLLAALTNGTVRCWNATPLD